MAANEIKARIFAGSLGWHDITPDLRQESAHTGGGISFSGGLSAQGSQASYGTASMVLYNGHGKYSQRNPMSPLSGYLTRNTPLFVYKELYADTFSRTVAGGMGTSDSGQVWNSFNPAGWNVSAGKATWTFPAVGSASTNTLTGGETIDSEQVVDIQPSAVATGARMSTGVVSRWIGGGDSYYWFRTDFETSGKVTVKISVRLNGSAGLEDLISVPTSITYSAGTTLRMRALTAGTHLAVKVWRATDAEPAAWTAIAGDNRISVAGLVGIRNWLVTGNTNSPLPSVTYDNYEAVEPIFAGEISEWPVRWHPTGNDAWVSVEASGILRRLNQGAKALNSPLYRTLTSYKPMAYMPLEDGSDSTAPTNVALGGSIYGSAREVTFSADNTLKGAVTTAKLGAATSWLNVKAGPASGNSSWSFLLFFKLDSLPTTSAYVDLAKIESRGAVTQWTLSINNTNYRWVGTASDGSTVTSATTGSFGSDASPTGWVAMSLQVVQAGSNVEWTAFFHGVGSGTWYTIPGFSVTYTGAFGNPTAATIATGALVASVGHAGLFPVELPIVTWEFRNASNGYVGETAGDRIKRLAREEGIPVDIVGTISETAPMGRQKADSFLNLLYSCAEADGGLLTERQQSLALSYRTRESLYNRPDLALSYQTDKFAELMPIEDADDIRNDVTVKREDGASARFVVESGPLSVSAVGSYADSLTLNLAYDEQAIQHAAWRAFQGTVDEARWPTVTVNLMHPDWQANPALRRQVAALNVGDFISIDDLPAFLPPGPVKLLIVGVRVSLDAFRWQITWTCRPGSVWTVAQEGSDTRVDSDTSYLVAPVGASDTTLTVVSGPGDDWTTDPDDLPIPALLGGEEVSITAVNPSLVDSFTRTTSNGWGDATSGQPWTCVPSAQFVTDGSTALIGLNATGTAFTGTVPNIGADLDVTLTLTCDAVAAGAFYDQRVRFRLGSGYVESVVRYQPSGQIDLLIQTNAVSLASRASFLPYGAGNSFKLRVQAFGNQIRHKLWPAAGIEPMSWASSVTDSSVAGSPTDALALVGWRQSGNTQTGLAVRFDNLATRSPQNFSVVRGVNRINKSHPAGTPMHVANPAIAAL
ncbi:hypothetical protein O7630_06745 [Micromonospora sp. WMMD718]|uniref:hypothetical protein n=1 Tax=unclassified Micromonospora TaxID=2617518 RepID=UPI000AEDEA3D|nr:MULTISPECIES: hypothetical protein [unclassified Micromonospora]MDG4750629.1 hypothetical protein [Micromonospora sp. WMMD718]